MKPYTESILPAQEDDSDAKSNYSRFTGKESTRGHDFFEALLNELMGLVRDGTFEKVNRQSIPAGTRIFNSRFVDELKLAHKDSDLCLA